MRLGQVIVFAKDLARMRAFYRDAIGLRLIEDRDDCARFDAGGALLALHAIPPAHASAIQIEDPPKPRSDTPVKLMFYVDDVAAYRERLRAAGAQTRDLVQKDDSRSSCDCVDPEGNVFRIANPR